MNKAMKHMKFDSIVDQKINMEYIDMEVIKPWISQRINEIIGEDDELLIEYIINQLEPKEPNPKEMQQNLCGFMSPKNARIFMTELWKELLKIMDCCDDASVNKREKLKSFPRLGPTENSNKNKTIDIIRPTPAEMMADIRKRDRSVSLRNRRRSTPHRRYRSRTRSRTGRRRRTPKYREGSSSSDRSHNRSRYRYSRRYDNSYCDSCKYCRSTRDSDKNYRRHRSSTSPSSSSPSSYSPYSRYSDYSTSSVERTNKKIKYSSKREKNDCSTCSKSVSVVSYDSFTEMTNRRFKETLVPKQYIDPKENSYHSIKSNSKSLEYKNADLLSQNTSEISEKEKIIIADSDDKKSIRSKDQSHNSNNDWEDHLKSENKEIKENECIDPSVDKSELKEIDKNKSTRSSQDSSSSSSSSSIYSIEYVEKGTLVVDEDVSSETSDESESDTVSDVKEIEWMTHEEYVQYRLENIASEEENDNESNETSSSSQESSTTSDYNLEDVEWVERLVKE